MFVVQKDIQALQPSFLSANMKASLSLFIPIVDINALHTKIQDQIQIVKVAAINY